MSEGLLSTLRQIPEYLQQRRMGEAGDESPRGMGPAAGPAEKFDWFKDLYLDREGGGGKDFIVPEKFINLMPGGDERIDEWNRLEAKKETFESGAGKNLMNEAIRIMDKVYDIDKELHAQINQEFLEIVNSEDAEPGEPYYYIIKKYGNMFPQGGGAGYNQGGRVGYQTGGITETRNLPPEYVEALGKTYAADLSRQAGIPSITTATTQQPGETAAQFAQRLAQAQQFGITKAGMADLAPTVAAQDPYQAAAYAQAVDPTTGLGGYQPYLTAAGTAAQAAGALTGTGAGTGAGSIASYMSPYQQQVIDATMADYDAQAAKSRLGLGAQAVSGGAFGSGRHGIAEAEFDALSGRGRASMLADLRQRGFQQASTARQQDLANQIGLSNLQSGLGQTQQDFARSQIAGLGGLGATQQAQSQAVLDAQRQFATMAVQEPRDRLAMLGQGVAGLSGLGSISATESPAAAQTSPLGTALGYGLMGADIYGRIFKGQS